METELVMVGVSHDIASVEIRERYHVAGNTRTSLVEGLRASGPPGREAVVLSTCNRTEVYVLDPVEGPEAPGHAAASATALLARTAGYALPQAARHLRVRSGPEAAHHLFRVTAGMESMVPGEAQVQGQVKEAFRQAREGEKPSVGPVLTRLFERALAVASQAREETAMGSGAVSVPGAALLLARKVFGSLSGRRALVVGAGDMSETAAFSLGKAGAHLLLANRTVARAEELAERVGGSSVSITRLPDALREADIVVSATAAPHPVVRETVVRQARGRRRGPPLLFVDLAVPRDIEPEVGELPGVFLYSIDELRGIVEEGLERRSAARPEAERIIDRGVAEFGEWYASRKAAPVIRALREEAESIRSSELERAVRGLGHLDPEDRERVEALSRRIVNKLLHSPTTQLRKAAATDGGEHVLESARSLFGLESEPRHPPEEVQGAPGEGLPRTQGGLIS